MVTRRPSSYELSLYLLPFYRDRRARRKDEWAGLVMQGDDVRGLEVYI
jgi:hypothetical protein